MIGADKPDAIRWHAIHTKAKQERRARCNLEAWGVENFALCIKQQRYNHYSGKSSKKRCEFAGVPIPIDDEIIYLIQSRVEHGFVRLDADLKRGDELRVQCVRWKGTVQLPSLR